MMRENPVSVQGLHPDFSAASAEAANPYAVWEETLQAIAAEDGSTLLLGGTDVGKTTFARLLINRAAASGARVALLDADLGQSEIGPPACVGLAFTERPVESLSNLSPTGLAFVGSVSSQGHNLEHLVAMRRLADLAAGMPLVVDTGGYISGYGAMRLHGATFELLRPRHLVAIQRGEELQPLLRALRFRETCRIHTLPVPAAIVKKPPTYRAQRRAMRFAAYFADAALHTFSFEEVALTGTWLGSGTPLAAHLLRFLNQVFGPAVRVYHAEMQGRQLGLMINRPIPAEAPAWGLVQNHLKALSFSSVVAPRLRHLLLGLEDGSGRFLGMGLLEALDFRRRQLGILTPARAPAAARVIRFGIHRVTPEGKEIGPLKPGELG
jgi:polynucleotide 5'-hydroxyl-kinase GRC3/NOL9